MTALREFLYKFESHGPGICGYETEDKGLGLEVAGSCRRQSSYSLQVAWGSVPGLKAGFFFTLHYSIW